MGVDCKVVRADDWLIDGVISSGLTEWLLRTLLGRLTECLAD